MMLLASNNLTMNSREIAELVGSRHDNVKRTIETLHISGVISQPQSEDGIKSANGVVEKLFVFSGEQGKRDSIIVVAQLCPEFTARLVDRWQELEAKQKPALPKSYAEALLEAGRLALENERKDEQLRLAAPKVEFVDNFVEASSGSMGFRKLAKLLEIKENEFRHFLTKNSIMYRLGGDWVPYQNHIDAGRFEVKAGLKEHETGNSHAFSQANFTAKGIKWIAGLLAQDKIDRINRDLAKQE